MDVGGAQVVVAMAAMTVLVIMVVVMIVVVVMAMPVAMTTVVVGLTYFSVVIGELVPKRLGLLAPEAVAAIVASPMTLLARVTRPLVWLFSSSSSLILRVISARQSSEAPVTTATPEITR